MKDCFYCVFFFPFKKLEERIFNLDHPENTTVVALGPQSLLQSELVFLGLLPRPHQHFQRGSFTANTQGCHGCLSQSEKPTHRPMLVTSASTIPELSGFPSRNCHEGKDIECYTRGTSGTEGF